MAPAMGFLAALLASALLATTEANLIPPGSCVSSVCSSLSNLTTPTSLVADKRIAFIYGRFNLALPGGAGNLSYQGKGGPFLNYEVVKAIELDFLIPSVRAQAVTTIGACCSLCAETEGCTLFQFFVSGIATRIPILGILRSGFARTGPPNFVTGQQCYLLTGGSYKEDGGNGTPPSGRYSEQTSNDTTAIPNRFIAPSFIGGYCNPGVRDDPHFTGAMGTRFDFNGEIGKTFNLISDRHIHVSIKLGGYTDSNTFGATRLENGKALRTWIKEIGFLWVYQGAVHSAVLSARSGKEQDRGAGYLSSVVIDGTALPVPGQGAPLEVAGFTLEFKEAGKKGSLDFETFSFAAGDALRGHLKLRPAHPLLQRPDDAEVHFNLQVTQFEATPEVHGVLGQTFRNTPVQQMKALEYRSLNVLLGGPVVADGASGQGFLDGQPKDYITSGLTAPDSVFSVPLATQS